MGFHLVDFSQNAYNRNRELNASDFKCCARGSFPHTSDSWKKPHALKIKIRPFQENAIHFFRVSEFIEFHFGKFKY